MHERPLNIIAQQIRLPPDGIIKNEMHLGLITLYEYYAPEDETQGFEVAPTDDSGVLGGKQGGGQRRCFAVVCSDEVHGVLAVSWYWL